MAGGGTPRSCGIIWLWRLYDARQDAALAKFVSAHLRRQLTRPYRSASETRSVACSLQR